MDTKDRKRVAVVGSGMAGLVAAYLLNQDLRCQYVVTLFESGAVLALDSASMSISNPTTGRTERVDMPMRAFAGGYYNNLRAMYDYLGVGYHAQPFLFRFSRTARQCSGLKQKAVQSPYFIHSSNNHRMPPLQPNGTRTIEWVMETLYVLVCYAWFTVCCFFVLPQSASTKGGCETVGEYLRRIKLPQYFVTYYLLPMMSSVATCTHDALRSFPASDVIEYKKMTHGQQHYTVSNGVQEVQRKLAKGIHIRLSATVSKIESQQSGVRVSWNQKDDAGISARCEEMFDRVVLATSPDVVGKIFKPLEYEMGQIPVTSVESVLHTESSTACGRVDLPDKRSAPAEMDPRTGAHAIHFQTSTEDYHWTEAIHFQPSGVLVTTSPSSNIDPTSIIKSSRFTRVLRTPESKRLVNEILGFGQPRGVRDIEKSRLGWRNGEGGVWLVGAWCWDGMVLLEGCVVSAMRVAEAMNVQLPWRHSHPSSRL